MGPLAGLKFYKEDCMFGKKMIKRGGLTAGLIASLLIVLGAVAMASVPKGSVAVVNGVAISQKDFNRALTQLERRFVQAGKKLEGKQLENVKGNILETLIDRELLYQKSQKDGIKISKGEVDKQIEGLKKQFPEKGSFEKALKSVGLTQSELETQIKRQLAVKKMIDKEIAPTVKISDKEAKAFYDSHEKIFKRPEEVRASHILIKVGPKATKKEVATARKKIEAAQKRLKKGEKFAKVAKEVSEGPSAKNGGDLGFFRRGQMVKPFEDAAFGMKVGQVSGIVRTRFGFHIIKVTGKKPASMVAFAKVEDKIKAYLKQKKIQDEVQAMLKSLRKHAKIERAFSVPKK